VEYVEVEFDFEVEGVVLHNVKALKCPQCREEVFSPDQPKTIRTQVKEFSI
jgi:YgiT-type zinc finger domain-containing protein